MRETFVLGTKLSDLMLCADDTLNSVISGHIRGFPIHNIVRVGMMFCCSTCWKWGIIVFLPFLVHISYKEIYKQNIEFDRL